MSAAGETGEASSPTEQDQTRKMSQKHTQKKKKKAEFYMQDIKLFL